jgi:hypothetical protein
MTGTTIPKLLILFSLSLSFGTLYGQSNTASEKKPDHEAQEDNRNPVSSIEVKSEPKSSFNKQIVIDEVKAQLAEMSSKALKELVIFCKENSIHGEFVVDMTLVEKGKVVTVFMVSSSAENPQKKNLLKNKLSQLRFDNIKIPKPERVKFRYTLTFN